MAQRIIKIATRTSRLATQQTHLVKTKLEQLGHRCEIIPIESSGDIELTKPIYELGITGVFTKQLDIALLEKQADIAVHSLKDVPTQTADNLLLAAVLERGSWEDVAIVKNKALLSDVNSNMVVASSSLRRKAQWLRKYPHHTAEPIRGNVQTRLNKFRENAEVGAIILAKAGLERLGLLPDDAMTLDWMVPAPAQGIIGIECREGDSEIIEILKQINHSESFIAGIVERQFMRTLLGGCSVPISALATISESTLIFEGAVHSFDGKDCFRINKTISVTDWENAGKSAAAELLAQEGAKELLDEIRNKKWDETDSVDQGA